MKHFNRQKTKPSSNAWIPDDVSTNWNGKSPAQCQLQNKHKLSLTTAAAATTAPENPITNLFAVVYIYFLSFPTGYSYLNPYPSFYLIKGCYIDPLLHFSLTSLT